MCQVQGPLGELTMVKRQKKGGKRSTKSCPWAIYDHKKQPQLSADDQLLCLSVWSKTLTVNKQWLIYNKQ